MFRGLFRRKPVTEDDLRAQQEAKFSINDAHRVGLWDTDSSRVGEWDSSGRDGRDSY